MNKKLPEVFVNSFDDVFNNKDFYYGSLNSISDERSDYRSIKKRIDEMFKSPNYVYKLSCFIKINGVVLEKVIVGRTENYLLTIDNERIKISDIEDIKVK